MFNFFKRKPNLPLRKYSMQFKVTYALSNGSDRSTGIVNITVPATSPEEAKEKLENFAVKRISINVVSCMENLF